MLEWIRGARIDMKTGVFIIVLTLIVWGVVVYVNLQDLVPEEFRTPVDTADAR